MTNSEIEHRKRQIRLKLGQLRWQINKDLDATRKEGSQLLSWRGYVSRYPNYILVAAFGIGLAASTGFGRKYVLRRLGMHAARFAAKRVGGNLLQEVVHLWSRSGGKS